ncbi:MAG: hypothetical protein KQH79_12555 [Bacteroidetes bacterium]|nr:hypothetical protein [Bacteroidota bacterium]
MNNKISGVAKLLITILLVAYISFNLKSQNTYKQSAPEVIALINQAEKIYTANDQLINGAVYPIPNPRIKGNPYLTDMWTPSVLYINSNTYSNMFIKYDLTIDNIILKIEVDEEVEQLVNLNKYQIDSFKLGNSKFINSTTIKNDNESPTYFEELGTGTYSLYVKYEKVFIKEYNNITPYGKYSSTRKDLFLFYNKQLHSVDRKSAFLDHFSANEQAEIKNFMKKNKINYRKATNDELKKLIKFSNALTQ